MTHDLQNILDKFTYHFKKVLIHAQNLALAKKQNYIEPIDILISLVQTKGALGSEILIKQKLDPKFLPPRQFTFDHTLAVDPDKLPQPSETAQQIIEKAVVTAFKNQHKYIGTEHLLWGITESDDQEVHKIWQKTDINIKNIQQHLNLILQNTSKFNEISTTEEEVSELENILESSQVDSGILEDFTIDLTNANIQEDIDPVIGRGREIDRMIQILSRRTKNNPVLLGDAGVGKTAIIEGLAKRIMQGKVPDILINKTILNLDISSLLAGTMYRGEFESRLKQVINEVKNNSDIIIFIDELHTIMGAGATAGSLDAANILKPALARGQLRCIGATTFEEYKKHIESDRALERRFQPIIIEESSETETYDILQGIKENYEKFHQVNITDQALQAAVALSKKFLPDKKLPDKAIDLIDEAAAKLKIKYNRQNLGKKIKALETKITECQNNKKKAILEEKYLEASEYKVAEDKLLDELLRLTALRDKSKSKYRGVIEEEDVKEVIARITGIPLTSITVNEKKQLLNLEKYLSNHIFSQEKALDTIANTIRKAKTGLQDQNRPLASFMFLGPSGVGKTETAKQLARYVFGGSHNLIRIDMSEFSESFNISKLIGAPAGYVGYKEANKLTDLVKNKPHSLILFDEIEKAHSDVFNLLLPILEEGELTDATGRTVNFRNCIIIMTSNIGLDIFNQEASLGFSSEENAPSEKFANASQQVLDSLSDHFPLEFLNRLDSKIIFEPINKIAARKIIKHEIALLNKRLAEQKIALELDNKIINQLLKKENAAKEGARSLKRLVDVHLTNQLAHAVLGKANKKFKATWHKDKVLIK